MKEQFLQRMKEYLQEDYEAYVKTLEEDAYRGLRVNTTKISVEAFLQLSVCECKPSAICPETFYIPHQEKGLGNHPAHLAGLFYMQEPSASSAVEGCTRGGLGVGYVCSSGRQKYTDCREIAAQWFTSQ